MIIRRRLRVLLLGLVPVGVVAGCSGGSPAATYPTSTTGHDTTAAVTQLPSTTTAEDGTETAAQYPSGKQTISLTVNGVERTALVVVPSDLTKPAPLVFAFHGHGGTGQNFDRRMNIEGLWPEAIVAYPNGVVGHKGRTDPEGTKTGWQTTPGESDDEDLAFYDALLADLESKARVDLDRIYLMGHSNGSAFVSLLLNVRGGPVAATANMSGQPGPYLRTDPPRSMFLSMGQNDPIVPYANQRRSVSLAEERIGADPSTAHVDGHLRTEIGRGNLELAVYDYPGGHEPPSAVPALIVAFFQRHNLSGG
jgi:polyhydroxybutyrate depolymerase